MEVLTSGGNGASWTWPTVDLLNETQVYCFAEQHGTLGNFLTRATDGWCVAVIRMPSSFGVARSSLGWWVPSMDPSVPYPLALLCGQTCKRSESTSALERAWAAEFGRPWFKSPFSHFLAGSSCSWYLSCLSLGFSVCKMRIALHPKLLRGEDT